MKKCIVISDSFKGSISSAEICRIARQTIPRFFPECELLTFPVADGGEGTVSCFLSATDAQAVEVNVSGPYGEPTKATYARYGDKAIIEMAETTTYGVGQLIRHAVESGCREIMLGLGGSATNDGGCGCAAALGTRFLKKTGESFVPCGKNLNQIAELDTTETQKLLDGIRITAMCDVDNPLFGENGAAYVFGPQKGADAKMVKFLDGQLRSLNNVLENKLQIRVKDIAGAGAAGGMGAGCIAFFGAELKSGIEAILGLINFNTQLEGADLVISGEGKIDFQSACGKVIAGIAKRTKAANVPLIAIVGAIDKTAAVAYEAGVSAMFGIDREAKAFEEYAAESS